MTARKPLIFTNSNLDERDFYLWIETTAKQLKEGRFTEIDLGNLLAEIESIGSSEERAVASNLVILLIHFWKYQYQSEKISNSWLSTIFE